MPAEVAAAAEHGNPPDIAELHHTVTRAALDSLGRDGRSLFVPVERAVAGRTEILGHPVVIDDMLPAARDFFRYDGELTSVRAPSPRSCCSPTWTSWPEPGSPNHPRPGAR